MVYTRKQIKFLIRYIRTFYNVYYEPICEVLEDSFISDDFNETVKQKLKDNFPDIYYILYVAPRETLVMCLSDYHEGPFANWKLKLILRGKLQAP